MTVARMIFGYRFSFSIMIENMKAN